MTGNVSLSGEGVSLVPGSGGGGGSLTVTDGTHTVASVTNLSVTGGTVGGTSPNATLTISGGGWETITSGVISTSTAYFDLTLPAGYALFQLITVGVQFNASENLVYAFSSNAGASFLNDTTHGDSYKVNGWNNLAGTDSVGALTGVTASSSYNAAINYIFPGDSANFAGSSQVLMTNLIPSGQVVTGVNPTATVTPTPVRMNLMRILPYGNGDVDPPTSTSRITALTYVLLGVAS